MAQNPNKEYAKETEPDIVRLWQNALAEYYVIAGLDSKEMKFYGSFSEIIADEDVKKGFLSFRHDKGKVDTLRSIISRNAVLIESGAGYIAQAATAAFPPAAAILTALTYVMKASGDMSKDYDKINSFFEELESFLKRISMLEGKLPKLPGYISHLVRVFTAIMAMLGHAKKATQAGRWRKFGRTLLGGGGDEDLAEATSALDVALKRLESATNIAVLRIAQEIKEDTTGIKATVENVHELTTGMSAALSQFGSTQKEISATLTQFGVSQEEISVALSQVGGHAQEIAQAVQMSRTEQYELISRLTAKVDQMFGSHQRSLQKPEEAAVKKGDSSHRPSSFNVVSRFFTLEDDPHARDRDFEFNLVEGTTQWFLQRSEFASWMDTKAPSPYLWVNGEAGMGKSFLAYSAVRELQKLTASDSKAFIAYYYFRQQTFGNKPLKHMICAVVNQIARLDQVYCDQVATDLMEPKNPTSWINPQKIFEKYIASKFQENSRNHLFLVLDGLDEISREQSANDLLYVRNGQDEMSRTLGSLFQSLQKISTEKTKIRVLMTGRPHIREKVNMLKDVQIVNLTKDDVKNDMQAIITAKLMGASRLRKLRPFVKRAVDEKLSTEADGLLYIDHVLRKLNQCHGDRAVLETLKDLPANISNLYDQFEGEVASRRAPEQLETLRLVYAWISFSKDNVHIDEINDIVKLRGGDKLFSPEEEISSRSKMILTIAGDAGIATLDDEDEEESDGKVGDVTTDALGVFPDTTSIVRFHNRSLRDYFREFQADSDGIRIPQSSAQFLMFEICAQVVTSSVSIDTCDALRQYAAANWALHFIDIDFSTIEDDQFHRAIRLVYDVLTNKNDVAGFFEKNFPITTKWLPYTSMLVRPGGLKGGRVTQLQLSLALWLERATSMDSSKFEPQVASWIKEFRAQEQPGNVLAILARAHIQNWLYTTGEKTISYTFAISALNFSDITPELIGRNKISNSWAVNSIISELPDLDVNVPAYPAVDLNATAYRAIASTLQNFKSYFEARKYARMSLNKAENVKDKFAALLAQATAEFHLVKEEEHDGYHYDLDDEEKENSKAQNDNEEEAFDHEEEDGNENDENEYDEEDEDEEEDGEDDQDEEDDEIAENDDENGPNPAYQRPHDTIEEALKFRPTSEEPEVKEMIRQALFIFGSCQYQLCQYRECVTSIEDARTIQTESLITGEVLSLIPLAFYERRPDGFTELMEKLSGWTLFDLMAWLTIEHDWSQEWDPHVIFQQSAKETGREVFAIKVYKQIIRYLEPRRSAGHVRNRLAGFYYYVQQDVDKAKALWLQTANSDVQINPLTGEEDDRPIWDAYLSVANVIYHQFRTSFAPRVKIKLLEEMGNLQQSRNSGPLQAVDTYGVSPTIVYANMIRKIGSEQEFEQVLKEAFDSCYTALTDGEEWNDVDTLCLLAKILAAVGGLEKEAQVVFSAQFSVVDPDGVSEEELFKAEEIEKEKEKEELIKTQKKKEEEAQAAIAILDQSRTIDETFIKTFNAEEARKAFIEACDDSKVRALNEAVAETITEADTATITEAETNTVKEVETDTIKNAETDTTKAADADATTDEDINKDDLDSDTSASESSSDPDGFDSNDPDTRWGDISGFSSFYCRCGSQYIEDWSTGPLYLCLLCTDVKLCQKCYVQLKQYNDASAAASRSRGTTADTTVVGKDVGTNAEGEQEIDPAWTHWTLYCGKNHKYIKGPAEGWKGIRNGKMIVDGEKVSFRKWLREIKVVKWPNAWREFWMREDCVVDIL